MVQTYDELERKISMDLFLTDRHRWIAAARQHFVVWEKKERYIFARMTPRVSLQGINSAGGYYRVGRHFPISQRQRLMSLIDSVPPSGGPMEQRFDSFVRSVRKLANQIAQESDPDGRKLRPISGVSKFLWYRFPLDGFIYDSQVLAAICKNGLTVRFDSMIDTFGGRPSDNHEWNFMIAAAAYRTFALPLHVIVAEVFEKRSLEPARAARLIDMLFWFEGGSGAPAMNVRKASEPALSDVVGEEAYERCQAILARLIGN